jgi:hypothetical protein
VTHVTTIGSSKPLSQHNPDSLKTKPQEVLDSVFGTNLSGRVNGNMPSYLQGLGRLHAGNWVGVGVCMLAAQIMCDVLAVIIYLRYFWQGNHQIYKYTVIYGVYINGSGQP